MTGPRAFSSTLVLVLLAIAGLAQDQDADSGKASTATATRPSDTDPWISEFNEPHLSWLPAGDRRQELLVFLPGTGGTPEKKLFFPFCETAAALGYHVVSLTYPDKLAEQRRCGESPDPDCDIKFREAIIRGGRTTPRKQIKPADTIENRLEKLLRHLDATQPRHGWDLFLDGRGGVLWEKAAFAGQSQGGGHSYVIGKFHRVARVITFGSPKDYSFHFKRPAKGFDSDTRTPLGRFFAFNHVKDNGNGCTHDQQREVLQQMGLVALGVADVEGAGPDYGHAHVLYTNRDVPSGKYHGSVLTGVNRPVWKYLLTTPVP